MKKLVAFIILMFLIPVALFAQVVEPEPFKLTLALVLAILAGLYEVVARIIPTVKQYSVIEKIFSIMLWVSNFLNNRKKKK